MAVDKLVDSTQLDTDLTSIANAIRTKGGTSASLAFPADFVSAIQAISGGGGGASGWTLLASGSYTKTGTATALSIPVSYSGTPKIMCVRVQEPIADTGQAVAAFKYIDMPNSDMAGFFANGAAQARGRTSANAYNYVSIDPANATLTATAMTWARVTSSLLWQPNTYNWYIYGEAST